MTVQQLITDLQKIIRRNPRSVEFKVIFENTGEKDYKDDIAVVQGVYNEITDKFISEYSIENCGIKPEEMNAICL